jgi:uncharacterized protein YndB with AHSA1/START domain
MDLKFKVFANISKPVHEVFEAVADPDQLSRYFSTGGAKGRLETGETVTWDFHDFPGAFPVHVIEVVPDERIVLEWQANEQGADVPAYNTRVTMGFKPADGGRTLVEIAEVGWRETPGGLAASYGNCMGWSQMLAALKAWLEHGINLREGMYR